MGGRVGSITTDIIADGLVFNMDAANRACYPGSGTTATNTIGNNVGTLSNTPLLSNLNFGVWELGGVDDQILLSSSLIFSTTFSLSIWINPTILNSNQNILGNGTSSQNWINPSSATNLRVKPAGTLLNFPETGGNNLSANVWNYIVIYRDSSNDIGIFVNGSPFSSPQNNSNTLTLATIGRGVNKWFSGKLGPFQAYNRALSSTEVLHNYNALKGRFE
jgi:hypothetical protein